MTKFTIKQDQILRLKVFQDHLAKMNNIAVLDTHQQYYINNNTLEIYALDDNSAKTASNNGAMQGEIKIDIDNLVLDPNLDLGFSTELHLLLVFFSKLNSDVDIQLSNKKLLVTSVNTDSRFSIGVSPARVDLNSIRSRIDTELANPHFQPNNVLNIDFSPIYKDLEILASYTKAYNLAEHELIEINPTVIRVGDAFGVVKKDITTQIVNKTIYIHRDIVPLIKNNGLQISSNDYYYVNSKSFGIRVLFMPPKGQWSYPSDEDIKDIGPSDQDRIKVKINAKVFFEKLNEFTGVFDTTWSVHNQTNFIIPDDFDVSNKFELTWTDGYCEIENKIPLSILERVDKNSKFSFIMSTKGLKQLEYFFKKDENSSLKIDFNSLPITNQHGIGVRFYTDDFEIYAPKMSP